MDASELISFVRQQLARQEAAIFALSDHRASEGQCVTDEDDPTWFDRYGPCAIHMRLSRECDYATTEYGLDEIEAKRRILDEHKPMDGVGDPIVGCHTCSHRDNWDELHVEFPCPTMRILAQPYAGREGWQEEWRWES